MFGYNWSVPDFIDTDLGCHVGEFGTSAVSVGPVRGRCAGCGAAPGQGRLRRRGARALRAPLDLRASAAPSGRACGQAWGLPGKGCAAPPNLARAGGPPAKILE